MKQVEERYISLLTDFGFKRIFGTAMNKDLLICFLNSLFNGRQVVKDVSYLNPEHVGDVYTDRKAIFDVYCEGENGEKFIVEMQNAYQAYFKDRSLFYSTFPIREQEYEASKMAYRDIKNSIDTAKQEGLAEGMEKGMEKGMELGMEKGMKKGMAKGMNQKALDIARNMLADGVDINLIMKYSGLTQEQIEKLK